MRKLIDSNYLVGIKFKKVLMIYMEVFKGILTFIVQKSLTNGLNLGHEASSGVILLRIIPGQRTLNQKDLKSKKVLFLCEEK